MIFSSFFLSFSLSFLPTFTRICFCRFSRLCNLYVKPKPSERSVCISVGRWKEMMERKRHYFVGDWRALTLRHIIFTLGSIVFIFSIHCDLFFYCWLLCVDCLFVSVIVLCLSFNLFLCFLFWERCLMTLYLFNFFFVCRLKGVSLSCLVNFF